jgi:SAM-dependent methyltransferase
MNTPTTDRKFAGSIPQMYEQYMVPLIFQPYADDIARRAAALQPSRVLEIACGTGVVTRGLAAVLPPGASIVATDLNQPMLDHAASIGTARPVEWQQADAMKLPFTAASFDMVVCQFGAMFFPDRAGAFAEAHRVLRPGGTFLFNVWDRIQVNEFADVISMALAGMFPADPPRFMERVPHGYHDKSQVAQDVAHGGFGLRAVIETVAARSKAESARIPAMAYCEGTPWRNEIEARDASRLGQAVDASAELLAQRFGRGPVDGGIQAHVITVQR